ncbi:MAG TPA: FtsX-like permease family protein, partial [Steroidobacteraceae bacterium]|nr:FtsX-like permease family protein [Steroidobacteraceae bacterium]
MKALRFALLTLLRDFKSGELSVMVLALLVAVSALTAVGFFTSRIAGAVEQQAGEVLAADLKLRSARPLDPAYLEAADARGIATARYMSFPSVVFQGEDNALAAIRAVTGGYPLRGQLRIADEPFGLARTTEDVPAPGEAWADSRLLARLGANVGDRISLGAAELTVRHVLDYRPDQGSQFVDLAPTLLINFDDVPATELIQPGSRVTYAFLFAGESGPIAELKQELESSKEMRERLVDVADASPQIKASMDRAGRFLNLAGLVSVLLAAIAVAMAARRYANRHLDTVALLKSLGASHRFVLSISVIELVLLAVGTALVGAVIGYLAQQGLAWLLKDLLRGELPPPSLDAALLGLVTSVVVLTGFALPPLLQLGRVPPARVLRSNAEPPPLRYAVVYGAAVAAVFAILLWIVRDLRLVLFVGAGTLATFAVLFAAGWLLVRALSGVRGGVGVAWRYGLANVARRGRDSIVQVVAFGLGIMVLLLLALVRTDLLDEWQASLPENAPNHFMINIRPDETEALTAFFEERGVQAPELVPMVRARLSSINGVAADDIDFGNDRAANFVEREANLTWSDELRAGNQLVAGKWWDADAPGASEVSVEREIAEVLGLELGDEITYDVAGEPITATVTSIREVAWDSFQPNFFMVFSPGTLDAAVGTYITSVYLDRSVRPLLVDLVRRFPEVTIIDIEAILSQVREVMDKASLAVQYVFVFTLFAGLTVLLAAIQATRDERRYESAMLRTLGASRRIVLQGVAAEFTTIGLLAGTLAATGATVAAYVLA